MDHEYSSDKAGSSVAGMGAAGSCGRVSRGDERPDVRTERDGGMAVRVSSLSDLELPQGECICDECHGDPELYVSDFGIDCPLCRNVGHIPDPDFYDAGAFNSNREFSTMPRLRGNGRGQL